ncbi:MAG: hypothetical protein ACP5HG_08805 [Anaerolineae bacterium]
MPNVLAFNRRYIRLNNTFKALVDRTSGLYFVEGHFYRHERHDEAFMIGTGIHWINFMEYVFGPIRHVDVERFPNPDNATRNRVARLIFDGGLQGLLTVFPCSGTQAERIVRTAARGRSISMALYGSTRGTS